MDEQLFKKRLTELAKKSYQQGAYVFTDFLDMTQLGYAYQIEKELGIGSFEAFGGTDTCERKMLRFGREEELGYEMPYPITCIHVRPLIKKFADELNHRDFLGAIMNLGIERDTIGDITVKENECWFFCTDRMADYLVNHLDKVKHTHVACDMTKEIPNEMEPELLSDEVVVASERMDGILAKIYRLSRTESVQLFQQKKVFLNGRQCENNSCLLKKGDVISVRGFGKFRYEGILYQTKKEKIRIGFQRYV